VDKLSRKLVSCGSAKKGRKKKKRDPRRPGLRRRQNKGVPKATTSTKSLLKGVTFLPKANICEWGSGECTSIESGIVVAGLGRMNQNTRKKAPEIHIRKT